MSGSLHLGMVIARCIRVAARGLIPFFPMADTPSCVCTTPSLSVPLWSGFILNAQTRRPPTCLSFSWCKVSEPGCVHTVESALSAREDTPTPRAHPRCLELPGEASPALPQPPWAAVGPPADAGCSVRPSLCWEVGRQVQHGLGEGRRALWRI